MRFQNPANGYVETVSQPILWTFLFGFFYFAFKGVWMHAALGAVVGILTSGLSWLVYPFFAPEIMRRHYLHKGWIAVDEGIAPGTQGAMRQTSYAQTPKPASVDVTGNSLERQPTFARRAVGVRVGVPARAPSSWSGADVLFWGGMAVCGLIFLGALGQIIDPEGARARKAQTTASAEPENAAIKKKFTIEAAPNGDASVVAQKIILENFAKSDCPLVTVAQRYGDGSIKAICNNGESFRVFTIAELGPIAMKCSAVALMGVSGC